MKCEFIPEPPPYQPGVDELPNGTVFTYQGIRYLVVHGGLIPLTENGCWGRPLYLSRDHFSSSTHLVYRRSVPDKIEGRLVLSL